MMYSTTGNPVLLPHNLYVNTHSAQSELSQIRQKDGRRFTPPGRDMRSAERSAAWFLFKCDTTTKYSLCPFMRGCAFPD